MTTSHPITRDPVIRVDRGDRTLDPLASEKGMSTS